MKTQEILQTIVPYVQHYPGGKGAINYSTWEDVTIEECILGERQRKFKDLDTYFRENYSKEKDKKAYKKWKEDNGLGFYPGILCSTHSVRGEKVDDLTGIMSIDVDQQDNPKLFEDPELLDLTCQNIQVWNPWIFARTKSIGHGLVFYAMLNIPGNGFKEKTKNYKKIYEYVKKRFLGFGVVLDVQCSDPNRQRYIAYDDNPWVREADVEPLSFDADFFKDPEPAFRSSFDYESHMVIKDYSRTGKFNIFEDFQGRMRFKIWRTMFMAFGFYKAKEEFWILCQELWDAKQKNPSWSKTHDAKAMYDGAIAKDDENTKLDWKKIDLDLLRKLGYEISENNIEVKNDILTLNESFENGVTIVPKGKYLLEYKDQILEFWKEHKQMLLVGSTGLGKTVLIKDISHTKKCIVIVPYNDMLCVYAGEQGKVKPIKQILSATNIKEFTPEESACVIWDQLYKIINQAKDYAIIVDECHVVGKSSNFRYSANSLYHKLQQLKDENREIMFVTATSTFEKDLYEITPEDTMLFDRQGYIRPIELCYNFKDEAKSLVIQQEKILKNGEIKKITHKITKKELEEKKYSENDGVEIIDTFPGKAKYRIIGDIVSAYKSNRYNYILIWSDQYNQFISTYLKLKDIPVHQIHKEESQYDLKIREDMEKLKQTETLEKGIYIFTQITENGFNFNNKEGKALIIIQDKLQNFAYDKIIQIIGRMRNIPYVYTKIYAENAIEEELSIQDKHTRAQIMAETSLELENNPIYEYESSTQQNEMRKSYNSIHGTPEMIKQDIEEYLNGGKYKIVLHDMSEDTHLGKSGNKFKRQQEEEAWNIIINETIDDNNIMDKVYARHLKQEFDYLVGKYGKKNVVNMVDILKKKSKSDKLYSTCLNEIEKYIPWLDDDYRMTQNEYFDKVFNQKIYGDRFKITPKLYKHMMSDIQDRNRWVEKYKNCISIEDVIKQEEESLLDDLMELKVIHSKAHSVKHKPHKPHKTKKLMLLEDGFVGTREQMAEHIGKNLDTVTRWKQSGKIVEVKASL